MVYTNFDTITSQLFLIQHICWKKKSRNFSRSDSSPPRNVSKGYTGHEVWTDREKQWSKGNVVSTFGIAKREEFAVK
jgi:hypothetical protein